MVTDPMDFHTALEFVTRLAKDLRDDSCPPEINQLVAAVKLNRRRAASGLFGHTPQPRDPSADPAFPGSYRWR
jgi:hypothetical protein